METDWPPRKSFPIGAPPGPAVPLEPVEVRIPTGPHYYPVKTWIGNVTNPPPPPPPSPSTFEGFMPPGMDSFGQYR